jgi:hypothetical protein
MIGRRAVLGLSLLSALVFSAFAVQSAAAEGPSVNTTMFTCVDTFPNNAGDFTDPHCDTAGIPKKERYAHVGIENGNTTSLIATNKEVTNSTKDSEPTVFKSKVGLTATEITCTTVETETANTTAHNEVLNMKHTITGFVRLVHKGCTVNKPAKCTIKEPIEANAKVNGVEGLGAGANEMGLELKGSGAEETFAEITYEGAECSLKGKTFKVKGSVICTSGPTTESPQTNKSSGATWVFTPKKEMQKLKFGVEVAEFSMIVTLKNAISKTPISVTTTT